MALDRPVDNGRVQTANVAVSASTVSANIMDDLFLMFRENDIYIFDISDIYDTAETGGSDQRGRRKTAELHTSGGKRAETWRGGGKW